MSTVQDPRKTWLATAHSLVANAVSGAKIAPHLLALAVTCLPLPLVGAGAGPQLASSPLVFALAFVLSAGQAMPQSYSGKVLSLFIYLFFPSLWISHSLDCYLTLAPSDCPQDIQAQSLP